MVHLAEGELEYPLMNNAGDVMERVGRRIHCSSEIQNIFIIRYNLDITHTHIYILK